jgi:PPP family 3-phenylpropionic acid transporter
MVGFLLLSIGIGIAQAPPNFVMVFLEDRWGTATQSFWFFGVMVVTTISLEAPGFALSSWFIARLGCFPLLISSMAITAVRTFIYTVITNPWLVITAEVLHGLAFVSVYATGVRTASELVPKDLQATGQGLFNLAYSSLGSGTGMLVFGQVYRIVGPIWAFRIWPMIALGEIVIAVAVFFAYRAFVSRRAYRHQKLSPPPAEDNIASAPLTGAQSDTELEPIEPK